jgi:hypothetical protein
MVLADLSGDRQHRDTALFLAIVAGRHVSVRAALADPDPSVQCRALKAWIRSGLTGAGELAEYLVDAPALARRVAYRSLRRHRVRGIADGGGNATLSANSNTSPAARSSCNPHPSYPPPPESWVVLARPHNQPGSADASPGATACPLTHRFPSQPMSG